MNLALISLNTESRQSSKYYNSQADGLAKALAKAGNDIVVYHPVPDLENERESLVKDGVRMEYIRCRHIGKHALIDLSMLDAKRDCYITASDNYLFLGKFYKWCQKNKILCLPYIGVAHSNNSSPIKRKIVDIFCNNVKFYKRMPVIVKTPALEQSLKNKGAKDIFCVPVGLDTQLLKQDYRRYSIRELKNKWNYNEHDKIILFVGRMTAEKQPEKMIGIFKRMYEADLSYRLLMVGIGELLGRVKEMISAHSLEKAAAVYEKVPNERMWELYRMSECYVNLNTHEIFGMAILEAMYYENAVIALKAPGPELIIENGVSGYICGNEEELIETALCADKLSVGEAAHCHVEECFLWESSASKIEKIICGILGSEA